MKLGEEEEDQKNDKIVEILKSQHAVGARYVAAIILQQIAVFSLKCSISGKNMQMIGSKGIVPFVEALPIISELVISESEPGNFMEVFNKKLCFKF